jgi:hypothetical protein
MLKPHIFNDEASGGLPGLQPPYGHDFHGARAKPPTTMRRKKKERRGWRKKKRKPALPNVIPGFVTAHIDIVLSSFSSTSNNSAFFL